MSILARNVIPLTLSARNVLLTVFLLLLVIALFFIPEIVNLHNSISGNSTAPTTQSPDESALVSTDALSVQRAPVEPQPSALDRILLLLDSGYLQQPAKEEQSIARSIERGSQVAPLESAQQPPLRSSDLLQDGRITWDKLRSKEVVRVFKDAEKAVATLLTNVEQNNRNTVYALLNYRNALQWMGNGGDLSVSADDAVNYIEKLDIEVTRAMLAEHVERADYILWTNVSLGAVLEGSKALALKQKNIAPFNPRFTLTSILIQETIPTKEQRAHGQTVRQTVSIKGFVVGRDIKGGIDVLRNGVRVATIGLSGINEFGMRTFDNSLGRFDGIISFRISSTQDDHFSKSYRFFPLIRRFPRNDLDWYQLPFAQTDPGGDPRDFDTRLDRFFRIGSPFGRGNTVGLFAGSEAIGRF